MPDLISKKHLSPNDLRLIEEAIRRLHTSQGVAQFDYDVMMETLAREIARGRRDLFSLVRAGSEPWTDNDSPMAPP